MAACRVLPADHRLRNVSRSHRHDGIVLTFLDSPGGVGRACGVSAAPKWPMPSSSAPAQLPTSPTSNRNLVLGKLRGSDQTVIRDITDIDHPSTIATPDLFGSSTLASFVSASAISYVNSYRELVWAPLSGSAKLVVAATCGAPSIHQFGWSPDGQSFTYTIDPQDPASAFQWHLASRGVDRVIGTAPLWCYCGNGSEASSLTVSFSPDGQFVSLVEFVGPTDLQVRRLDGSLVGNEIRDEQRSAPSPVTLGVWAGTDLFYRGSAGVERRRDGATTLFLPGVAWIHPKASPKGDQIVYAVRGSDGLSHVSFVSTSNGQAHQLSSRPAFEPFFLSSRYVWYKGERLCETGDPCNWMLKTIFSGKTYIYDLQSGTEWESIITDIADVWPHGA